ncbi:Putative RNA polymerase II transcriptional coactivator [Toxocara canis]|uniref:Putative RNA polymerase II transcriptional coactivator n=1 Tax=Toxocara canis TaxID=6265 RepID=A0A0B2VTK0_TOXCA|nr:Putative RNA polymerase II transcriptional coactivator [Toxocara canis]
MSDSDSSFEEKKTKKKASASNPSSKKRKADADQESSSDEGVIDKTPIKKTKEGAKRIKNTDGDEMLELGKMRFVTVRSFKGKALIDIREYYQDKGSGEMKPGRKGISLSREQYENLKALTTEIDERLRAV